MKIGILAVAALLLGTRAFADEATRVVTIEVAGSPVATFSSADQPKGSQMIVTASGKSSATYDTQTGTSTVKGKFTVEVKQGEKTLWSVVVPDGTATVKVEQPPITPKDRK